jgi:hypothetical protein
MIYLATPYSDPSEDIRNLHFIMACKITGALIKKGYVVFSPIAHSHPIAINSSLGTDWKAWESFDKEMIGLCEELWVADWSGGVSKGIQAEIQIAQSLEKPIIHLTPNDISNLLAG